MINNFVYSVVLILAPRRPRKLLVIVNPISGSGNGMKIYQNTAAGIFKLANVQTDVKGENSETFIPKISILINYSLEIELVFYSLSLDIAKHACITFCHHCISILGKIKKYMYLVRLLAQVQNYYQGLVNWAWSCEYE